MKLPSIITIGEEHTSVTAEFTYEGEIEVTAVWLDGKDILHALADDQLQPIINDIRTDLAVYGV